MKVALTDTRTPPLRNCLKSYCDPKPRGIREKNGEDEGGVARYSD